MRPITVPDPLLGEIDITDVAPIIDSTHFQRLRSVKQLGTTVYLYPNATHSRFAHCIGAYHRAKQRIKSWRDTSRDYKKKGINVLSSQEERNIAIYALTHDIGHGPLSHVIEDVTSFNHEENGKHVIKDGIKKVIITCGGNPTIVHDMLGKKNPLGSIVDDKVLGVEKWDYLERDLHFSGAGVLAPPHLKDIEKHVIWFKNQLMITSEAVHPVRNLILFYWNAYKEVYFSPKSLFYQRLFQKMIHKELAAGTLKETELWNLNDGEIEGRLKTSVHGEVRSLFERGMQRTLHRAIVFRLAPYLHEEHCEKNVHVSPANTSFLTAFEHLDADALEKIEHKIADIAGIDSIDILFVPVSRASHKRFSPHTVPVLMSNLKDTVDLFDHYTDMRPTLKTHEESFLAVRIFCNQRYLPKLIKKAKEIKALLETHIQ
ncbi:MAG: hypothetical protein HZA35_00085 [Parcubacteria group bacterium]|nr:hypothetical protein [Parcubacteria group bacterium]